MKPSIFLSVLLAAAPVFGIGTNTLQSISPATAPQGSNGVVITFTLAATPPPPANMQVASAMLGAIAGSSLSRPTTNTVLATFNIPGGETPGAKDVTIAYQGGNFFAFKAAGFTVIAAPLRRIFPGRP